MCPRCRHRSLIIPEETRARDQQATQAHRSQFSYVYWLMLSSTPTAHSVTTSELLP